MGKYEHLAVTGNAAILAVIHTVYGAFISYLFFYLFDEFDDSWKARSKTYQLTDVIVEIMLIAMFGLLGFLLTFWLDTRDIRS